LTYAAFSGVRPTGGDAPRVRSREVEVAEMATTWELMGVCIADAEKAEELVRDLAFRKELRLDPERALAAFVLSRHPARAAEVRANVGSRQGQVRAPAAL